MSDDFPNRQSIRLPGYDYSQNGYYFITICTHEKQNIFGDIVGNTVGAQRAAPDSNKKNAPDTIKKIMKLNEIGKIVQSVWYSLPKHHPVKLDEFQIMPNHIHFILILIGENINKIKKNRNAIIEKINESGADKNIGSGAARCAPTSIGSIVRSFKSESTKQIRILLNNPTKQIFQRNYYEHIIRSEREYKQIVYYIRNNPQNWGTDENNING